MALHVPKAPGFAQMLKDGAKVRQNERVGCFSFVTLSALWVSMLAGIRPGVSMLVVSHVGEF